MTDAEARCPDMGILKTQGPASVGLRWFLLLFAAPFEVYMGNVVAFGAAKVSDVRMFDP